MDPLRIFLKKVFLCVRYQNCWVAKDVFTFQFHVEEKTRGAVRRVRVGDYNPNEYTPNNFFPNVYKKGCAKGDT